MCLLFATPLSQMQANFFACRVTSCVGLLNAAGGKTIITYSILQGPYQR